VIQKIYDKLKVVLLSKNGVISLE